MIGQAITKSFLSRSIQRTVSLQHTKCLSTITMKFDKIINERNSNNGLIKRTFQKTYYRRLASTISVEAAIPVSKAEMFCRQCEQTKDGVACTTLGICGKTPETAAIQDTLLEVIKSVSIWAVAARKAGATAEDMMPANEWSLRAAFSTLTNVNFSESRIAEYIHQGMVVKRD